MVFSPTVLKSRIRSLRRDLCGRRLPPWVEGGREVGRKGRGCTAPAPRDAHGWDVPAATCFWRAMGEGGWPAAAARAELPKLTLFCHLVPRVQIARAHRHPPGSLPSTARQSKTPTQFYGPARITGTSAVLFWFFFFLTLIYINILCAVMAQRGGILCCR